MKKLTLIIIIAATLGLFLSQSVFGLNKKATKETNQLSVVEISEPVFKNRTITKGILAEDEFDFNDGTCQGWSVEGPYDEDGDGPFSSNFSNSWADAVSYPTAGLSDATGDGNGSYKICNVSGHGITNPGATYWKMFWVSPDLSTTSSWQNANGFTVKILNYMEKIAPAPGDHLTLYIDLHLTIYDHDESRNRYFASYASAQAIANWIEDPNWISKSFDWSSTLASIPNYTIEDIMVSVWGNMADYFEGGIYLDEVAPIPGTAAPPEQNEPQLSINEGGYSVLCWTDTRDGDPRTYFQLFTNKGFPYKGNIKVLDRAASVEQEHPDIAMNNLGHFVVVWQDDHNGNDDIYAQMYTANGEKINSEFIVNDDASTEDQTHPAIAMNGEGDFVICWTDNRDGGSDIYAQRYDSEGTALSSNFRVNETASYSRGYSDIDMNESGDFVIVWQDARNALVDYIYGRRYNSSGTSLGDEFQANADLWSERSHETPSVALQSDGKFMVCYVIAGTVDVLYLTHYDSDGSTLIDYFEVPDVGTASNNAGPAVAAHSNGGFSVVWHSDRNGTYDIFGRNFNNAGAPLGGSVRVHLNATEEQKNPCVGIDDRGVGVIAWEDNLSGNWKINAFWLGPLSPLNPTAGDGFNAHVPLTWDHLYAYNDIDVYKIYRSTSPGGPYDPPITVDLSLRGALGRQMRDWIDTDVINGTTYYYKISAMVLSVESQRSVEVSATPSADGYQITAGYSTTTPTIDGQISSSEWDDATEIDIANPDAPSPITLYVKNDDNYLYFAIDDPNDNLIDNGNLWGIIFDEDNNNMWDATSSSDEGLITINNFSTFFTGYWGTYPNSLGADVPTAAAGITKGISTASGNVQYEVSFNLATSPINASPGETIGITFMLDDPTNFYGYHYGYAAEWPAGALWDAAPPLGELTLAEPTGVRGDKTSNHIPSSYSLSQNYPNPFNPETVINYTLPKKSHVNLVIYNIAGEKVRTLVDMYENTGHYSVKWDGKDDSGNSLSAGLYLCRIHCDSYQKTMRMILLK